MYLFRDEKCIMYDSPFTYIQSIDEFYVVCTYVCMWEIKLNIANVWTFKKCDAQNVGMHMIVNICY